MTEKTKIISLVVFLLFLVGMLGLIVWGVVTHTESGLDNVCWYNGRAHWPEYLTPEQKKKICDKDISKIKWTKIPLRIATFTSKQWQKDALLKEIKHINRELGTVFISPTVITDSTTDVDIRVIWDVPWTALDRLGGCSLWRLSDKHLLGQIQIYEMKFQSSVNHVLSHELGHCALGLAHDDFESSTMYRAAKDEMWYSGPKFRNFTDYDIAEVKKHYGF